MVLIHIRSEHITMNLRGIFPLWIIHVNALELEPSVLELFEQPNINQRVVEAIVVYIDFGLARVELIPLDSDIESIDFFEPNLAVEDLAKARPYFVPVYPKAAEQPME